MFKSSFSKYLTAFVIIILIAFLMLSGIITSMIRTHVTADKEEKLQNSCSIITNSFETDHVEAIDAYIKAHALSIQTLAQLVKADYDFNVLITDASGKVLLSTYQTTESGLPSHYGDLGNVAIENFDKETDEGREFLTYRGELSNISKDRCLAYGMCITTDDEIRGYVFTLASTTKEDVLISVARKTVINSSIWVMLAAVIAAYFITERIVHPLKNMTRAAKSFAKGDFSERIAVNGRDEVSELALAFNNMAESLENLESLCTSAEITPK